MTDTDCVLTDRMRKSTRQIHNKADRLVNFKLGLVSGSANTVAVYGCDFQSLSENMFFEVKRSEKRNCSRNTVPHVCGPKCVAQGIRSGNTVLQFSLSFRSEKKWSENATVFSNRIP